MYDFLSIKKAGRPDPKARPPGALRRHSGRPEAGNDNASTGIGHGASATQARPGKQRRRRATNHSPHSHSRDKREEQGPGENTGHSERQRNHSGHR